MATPNEMDDHDQRFKTLLREFLPEFFTLFFSDWAPRFDFAGTEWLEQEAFLDPPGGEKRILDVVAKVPTRVPVPNPSGRGASHSIVVVNIEIESPARATEIRPRMLWHYDFLRRRYGLPVFPVCLFLKVGMDGVGWDSYEEHFWEQSVIRFEYAYIGLPALNGLTYLRGDNLLGSALAALMNLPATDRARIKAEGLAKITDSRENDVRKELLAECFDNYLKLELTEQTEFEQIQAQQPPKGPTMVISRWRREGIETGRQEGQLEGQRNALRLLLTQKFGPLPPSVESELAGASAEQLADLLSRVLMAISLADLGLNVATPTNPEGN